MPGRPPRKFPSIPERARWFAERAGSLPNSASLSRLITALQLANQTPNVRQDAANVLFESLKLLQAYGYRVGKEGQNKAILIDSEGKSLNFKTETPRKQKGMSSFGPLFSVKKLQSRWAILAIPINPSDVGDLNLTTAVLARWEYEKSSEANLIEASLFSDQHNMLFSRITKPGIYQALALPKNTWLVNLIETLGLYWPWLRMEPSFRQREWKGIPLLKRICQLILCNDDIDKISPDKLIELGLGERPSVPPRLGGGNICDQCPDGLLDLKIENGKVVTPIELKLWHLRSIGPRSVILPPEVVDYPAWISIGPLPGTRFWGIGRVTQIDIHPTNSNILIAGTSGGGVWRTHDRGEYWWPLMHNEPTLTIGAVAFSQSNPQILYAASGEDGGGYDPAWPGAGVYRSDNGGSTWTLTASVPSTRFSAITVHPSMPNVVYVAGDQGLHKSVNGGVSWVTLFSGRITDIVLAHNDPDRIYIGVSNQGVYRLTPQVFDPGINLFTPGSQTIDSMATFVRLDEINQLPSGAAAGWIKLAIGRNSAHGSNFLAAKLGPDGSRIFTTVDGGDSWAEQVANVATFRYDEWASVIAVDPQNERRLYAGAGETMKRSNDGGATWSSIYSGIHPDQQDLVFDQNNPNVIYLANDGGIYRSSDAGTTWDPFENTTRNMRISQVYDIDISQRNENIVACGTQDNGIYYRSYAGVWRHFNFVWDGTQVAVDQTNPEIVYFSAQNGINNSSRGGLSRTTNGGASITPLGTTGLDISGESPWVTILKLDPTDPIADPANNRVVFVCGINILYRSTNSGSTWQRINDSGGNAFTTNGEITALEFAPSDPSILYLGTKTGALYRATGGGTTASSWTRIDTLGAEADALFPNTQISGIGINPNNSNYVYIVFAGNGVSYTGRPNMILNPLGISHLFKTTDGGTNWEDASGGFIPLMLPDVPTSAIAVDDLYSEVAYVGTDVGVYRTSDGGTSWTLFQEGLARSPITELRLHRSSRLLIAATMGRGVYSRTI
jgi:photosystem II stability/assembly factor-like uncharacterized protein